MSEKSLERYLTKKARDRGFVCDKYESPGRAGVPDRILIKDGHVIFIELKNPNGKGRLSKLQKVVIREYKKAGADVRVISNKTQVLNVLK